MSWCKHYNMLPCANIASTWDFANMYVFLKINYVESIRVFILKGIMSFLQKMRENI